MKHIPRLRYSLSGALAAVGAAIVAGCSSPVPPKEPAAQAPVDSKAPAEAQAPSTSPSRAISRASSAATARAYRADAASHLYAANSERIYKGRLPPMLYAIGVLQVEVDSRGAVR